MNKTPNYSLNQWEAGDRVLRTDFNADNAKIDAALGAIPAAVLYRGKLTAAAASMTIDLSGKEPEKCIGFLVWVQLPVGEHSLNLTVSGGSGYHIHSNSINSTMNETSSLAVISVSEKGAAPAMIQITAGRKQSNGRIELTSFTPHFYYATSPSYSEVHGLCYVSTLNNLKFVLRSGNTVVPAGTEVAVIGFRI